MGQLWSSWTHLGWVIAASVGIYAWVLVALRINGLRTFASFSGYDFVMTVAIGSIVASAVLSPSVALIDGVVGVAALMTCQRAVTKARSSRRVERAVDNEPIVLVAHGVVLSDNLALVGVTVDDVRQKIRRQGIGRFDGVAAVVFETTGDVSIVPSGSGPLQPDMFAGVRDADRLSA